MRAWYDILGLDRRATQDEAGIRESAATATALVRREADRGVRSERVVLAGFSQGGAIALFRGLRHPERLAGIMALSTWLPLADRLAAEAHPANAAVPVFMAHGTWDATVPIDLARQSRQELETRGYDVEWHEYPMAHAVHPDEIADIRAWFVRVLPGGPR